MHFHQLKYFVAIVETGSVTKAAERCYISQPSISQQLNKLEDSVGKPLFIRAKGKLIITDAGKVMYEQALAILANVEQTKQRIHNLDENSGGALALGILPTLAPFILPLALSFLSKKYPEARVTVREDISDKIIDGLACGELDIIIDALPFADNNLKVEPLFVDEFYLAVHRDHDLAKQSTISIDALEDMPFILLEDIHCMSQQISQYCMKNHVTPKVMFQASQLATVKQLIELQYGVSLLPRVAFERDAECSIRYIKLKGEPLTREIVMATGFNRYLGPAAQHFMSLVKTQFQSA